MRRLNFLRVIGLLTAIWGEKSGYELDNILDEDRIADAALHRHLEVVKYLREIGVSWDENTCAGAANGGHLELLKWARVNQCPWDKWTYMCGTHNGDPALFQYLEDERCPMWEYPMWE